MGKWYRLGAALLAVSILFGGIRACQLTNLSDVGFVEDDKADEDFEPGLTLKDVTLEQPDENGQLLWRVHGDQVTYSPDQKTAKILKPDGELFQDGNLVYRVKADIGEIFQQEMRIFLRGNIVATGVENDLVLRGNELEWHPEEDILIVSDRITGDHPKLNASANQARVFNQAQRLELEGEVIANTTEEPLLKLQTDSLVWFIDEERIEGHDPLRVEHFKDNRITDWVYGENAEVDLTNTIVTLNQNVQAELLELPLNIISDSLIWKVEEEALMLNQPVEMNQPEREVTVTARRAEMDLNQQIVRLFQDVQAVGRKDQSELIADRLTWNVPTQEVLAEGNVNYRQADPPMNLTGPEALGRLEEQTIVVSGGRVITEITPE